MRKKIIGILVCTLLIAVTGTTFADWEEGEPYKMHYPQLPDPNGYDVDWGDWELADDWDCTETGTVDDIHFWISWFENFPMDIPLIEVSIWSNEPHGPNNYSIPKDPLWNGTFIEGQFIVAGPWTGYQYWYMPWGELILIPHYSYYQINIKNITDLFKQIENETYWLVIKMPLNDEYIVGWKTTYEDLHFRDYAVWLEPSGTWSMIDGIDFAFVITGEPLQECCLQIVNVTGGRLATPSTKTVDAIIANIGTGPCYNVSWNFTFNCRRLKSGPNSGVKIPASGTVTVSSDIVRGWCWFWFFRRPCTVTVNVDCLNNVCGPQSVTKNVRIFIILWRVW